MAQVAQRWTVAGLAAEFGLNHRTVAKRLARVQPVGTGVHGGTVYLMQDAAPALLGPEDGRRSSIDLEEARQRKTAAEAQLAELELARQSGEVVGVEDVGAEVEKRYAAVRSRLMAMPPKLAPVLCPDNPTAAFSQIEAAVIEALAELSEGLDGVDDHAGS